MTFDFTSEELMDCANGHDLDFPPIPCHSQNIERAVATTSEAAEKVIGQEKRHTLILQMNKSRKEVPKNATKQLYMAR